MNEAQTYMVESVNSNLNLITAIGGTCTTSENCRPVNDTACISGICVCIDSFVADSSNNQCLRSKLLSL